MSDSFIYGLASGIAIANIVWTILHWIKGN